MRLLHIADFHFDRAFEGLPQNLGIAPERLEEANQQVWERTVQLALEQKVDVVILAGDTFHQVQSSLKMQRIFFDGLNKLAAAQIQIVITFGNHDYYQENKFWFSFPETALVFTEEQVQTKTVTLASGKRVAFSGFSYQKPWIVEEKAREFPRRSSVDFHIGIYHGELGSKNRYAPFQVNQLQDKGYDYWALGHIHKGQELFERGYYAGTPQGHNQKETAGTGVLVVDLEESAITVNRVSVADIYFMQTEISLKSLTELKQLGTQLVQQIVVNQDSTKLTLLRLAMTDYQHLGQEFTKRINSGEVLPDLNQQLKNSSIVVTEIQLVEPATKTALNIPAELLAQSFGVYQDAEIFSNALKDLTANPDLRGILPEDFQTQVLQAAQDLIKQQQ